MDDLQHVNTFHINFGQDYLVQIADEGVLRSFKAVVELSTETLGRTITMNPNHQFITCKSRQFTSKSTLIYQKHKDLLNNQQ